MGHSFLSYVYEPGIALPIMYKWLLDQPKVIFIEKKLKSLDELLYEDFDVVVNSTGAGARYFVNDVAVKPISGHVLRVEAPWVHFVMACGRRGADAYIIPK